MDNEKLEDYSKWKYGWMRGVIMEYHGFIVQIIQDNWENDYHQNFQVEWFENGGFFRTIWFLIIISHFHFWRIILEDNQLLSGYQTSKLCLPAWGSFVGVFGWRLWYLAITNQWGFSANVPPSSPVPLWIIVVYHPSIIFGIPCWLAFSMVWTLLMDWWPPPFLGFLRNVQLLKKNIPKFSVFALD